MLRKGENRLVCQVVVLRHCRTDRSGMDFFRGLVAKGEKSERVVELTAELVKINPGHYSVWSVRPVEWTECNGFEPGSCRAYRSETLRTMRKPEELVQELELLDELVKAHLKSYQVW
jgi:protein farnesyltransferase/geranylgeranyltransferase type-1 subunit alpha